MSSSIVNEKLSRLYVGNLCNEVTDKRLRDLFQEKGINVADVHKIWIKKGFAFVDFLEQQSADLAIDRLQDFSFMGQKMTLQPAVKAKTGTSQPGTMRKNAQYRIFISGFDGEWTCDDIRNTLENWSSCILSVEKSNSGSFHVTTNDLAKANDIISTCNGRVYFGHRSKFQLEETEEESPERQRVFPSYYATRFQQETPLKILIPSEFVGAVIGRGGQTVKDITGATGARVDITREYVTNSNAEVNNKEKIVNVIGARENCSGACRKILEILAQEADGAGRHDVILRMLAPDTMVGMVIGKGGSTIKKIMHDTQTKIQVSTSEGNVTERIITIRGSMEGMSNAESLISEKLRSSAESEMNVDRRISNVYSAPSFVGSRSSIGNVVPRSMPFLNIPARGFNQQFNSFTSMPNFVRERCFMYIPKNKVGAVIGPKGINVKKIIEMSGSSLKIENEAVGGEEFEEYRRVSLFGTVESHFKAQTLIFQRLTSEERGEGITYSLTLEFPILTSQVGRLIGKRGSTVKDLQRACQATVKLLTEDGDPKPSKDETFVRISGTFEGIQAAQLKIRSMIVPNGPKSRGDLPIGHSRGDVNIGEEEPELKDDTGKGGNSEGDAPRRIIDIQIIN